MKHYFRNCVLIKDNSSNKKKLHLQSVNGAFKKIGSILIIYVLGYIIILNQNDQHSSLWSML
ncbi:hypothetical protein M2326_003044 [Flavobacterium sp. 7A]|nr:hypothetical protein [Flavobacterium sp. 7A]